MEYTTSQYLDGTCQSVLYSHSCVLFDIVCHVKCAAWLSSPSVGTEYIYIVCYARVSEINKSNK